MLSRHFSDMCLKQIRRIRNKPGYKSLLSNAFQDSVALRQPENLSSGIPPASGGQEGIDSSLLRQSGKTETVCG